MKKLELLFVLLFVLILTNTSCTGEDVQPSNSNAASIKETAKLFGEKHNESLNFIYKQLTNDGKTKSLSVNSPDLKESVLSYANKFIAQETGNVLKSGSSTEYFTVEDYEKNSIESIKEKMSERELYYIEQLTLDIEKVIDGKNFDYLLDEVINDDLLTVDRKTAVCIFICTAEKSAEYWKENYKEWQELIGNDTRLKISANAERVVFADCWWGWYGFLSSGCNPFVGAGGAIAGSALSALNAL
jgi:hypothetical protein